jgi:hypothetical protein
MEPFPVYSDDQVCRWEQVIGELKVPDILEAGVGHDLGAWETTWCDYSYGYLVDSSGTGMQRFMKTAFHFQGAFRELIFFNNSPDTLWEHPWLVTDLHLVHHHLHPLMISTFLAWIHMI